MQQREINCYMFNSNNHLFYLDWEMFRIAARSIVNQSVRRASSVEIPEGAMAFSFSSPFEQYFDHDVTIKQAWLLLIFYSKIFTGSIMNCQRSSVK